MIKLQVDKYSLPAICLSEVHMTLFIPMVCMQLVVLSVVAHALNTHVTQIYMPLAKFLSTDDALSVLRMRNSQLTCHVSVHTRRYKVIVVTTDVINVCLCHYLYR